ncbi:MAG TPA: ATP-binding protein [Candidatus Anaerobutyricum stercoris]|uniref:ATP-binding protein n=1 Tax=Candidatus Anaerobutyricum stercoris TaxID=2838457 RepID=A0A9D2EJ60_9FIRM|nr:ATP-binding protein [Candidatus Anaerobutyricum stercoris]
MEKKKLPVGIENFEEIITEDFYYVDKTEMIKDLLNKWSKVNLFTRPRRFGKSLNMSMLKAFFEIGCDEGLFAGLKIAEETMLCENYMGRFPVVSISLKGIEEKDYQTARNLIVKVINEEARRLQFLLESSRLTSKDKELFSGLLEKEMDNETLVFSLRELSELLHKHYGEKVIILIDEYDVPLAKANEHGYYDQMTMLIRNLFEQTLKTNDSLYFAVLTGCLRVAKESIFTGLNNPKVLSITTVRFDEYFGFTDSEVKDILCYYHLEEKYEQIKSWYDGYHFGNVDVYCPCDVISYCDELTDDRDAEPKDYWSNTSSNDVVKHFIERMDKNETTEEMEELMSGATVSKEIHEELTYQGLYDSVENIWSVLFMTGYLTYRGKPKGKIYHLTIPNMEIRNIFKEQIMRLFLRGVEKDGEQLNAFCDSLQKGNAADVERLFTEYLSRTISIRDTFVRKKYKENFYHGILLGILGYKKGWYVKSNEESGDGYSDILIKIQSLGIGILIEIKYADKGELDKACNFALKQITQKGYAEKLTEEDCHIIFRYGIACYNKRCRVVVETERRFS